MESETGFYFSTNKVKKQLGIREGRGKRGLTRGRSKKESSTQSRERGQGGTSSLFVCPLQGQGTASLVGFGATPQLFFRATNSKETANKGAGSEASLPVTSRVRRRAPKPLYQPSTYCRAKWARPSCWSFKHSGSFPKRRDFAPAGARRGLCARPLPLRSAHSCFLTFIGAGRIAAAAATRGLCARPLDPFGCTLPCLSFLIAGHSIFPQMVIY